MIYPFELIRKYFFIRRLEREFRAKREAEEQQKMV